MFLSNNINLAIDFTLEFDWIKDHGQALWDNATIILP